MAALCERRNPLTRSGTNQEQRRLPALQGDTFRLDEREPADLILFAERLSRQIQHYDLNNVIDGDWLPFFSSDISAVLAGLSELPVASMQAFARAIQEWLAEEPTRPVADLANHFKLLFYLPLMLLNDISAYFERLPREHPLAGFLTTLIATDAKEPLVALIAYYEGALNLAAPLFADTPPLASDYNTTFNDADPNIQLPSAVTSRIPAQTIAALPISDRLVAGLDPNGWDDFYAAQTAITTPYEDSIGDPNEIYQQIYDALNYNLLSKALERLFALAERVTIEAQRSLDESLTIFSAHTPHYGLWLAFLRLFAHNQLQQNQFTQRHLDFYYSKVLGLCPRKAVADRVHLLFELNKNQADHLLSAADVRFRGGKDTSGKEILYKLDSDIVVNRAKVASLMALYQPAQLPAGAAALGPFAATIVNSSDGAGGKLPKESPRWRPFGPALGNPTAHVGFGVADRALFLREGTRKIVLTMKTTTPAAISSTGSGLRVWLTGEEGWVEFSGAGVVTLSKNPAGALVLTVNVDGSLPMIIGYDAEIHGPGFTVALPILRCELDYANAPTAARSLHMALNNTQLTEVKLDVEVTGLRNFTLQNETGIVDPSKPFLPFGPAPSPKAAFILGSSELFSKRLAQMSLHLEWEQLLTKGGFFVQAEPASWKVKLAALAKGAWNESSTGYVFPLFASLAPTVTIGAPLGVGTIAESDLAEQSVENETYGPKSSKGFIRLELNYDFGHREFPTYKAKALIDYASGPAALALAAPADGTGAGPEMAAPQAASASESAAVSAAAGVGVGNILIGAADKFTMFDDLVLFLRLYNFDSDGIPYDPYTPKAKSLTLSYKVTPATPARFFHLYPFGPSPVAAVGTGRLLPHLPNEGELYIGVEALDPPQRLTLLFQVVDGTANPLKPTPSLKWDYLKGNTWVAFDEQEISDGTLNLTGTGIVGLAMPIDADTAHTLLPAGLHWVRLAAAADADALNSLLSVDAQAATATFANQGNDPAFLAAPLTAGTISKFKVGDAAVKKVAQPLPSFGGASPEASEAYTIRSSERLRHKQRAVTMWDYEHLVLEKFPSVWKVKCINHTLLQRDAQQVIVADNEVAPGHVLVVLLPNLRGKAHPTPRLPYADKRTITAVDGYLRPLFSPFVRLEVQNPRFEEVQVQFEVAFMPGIADTAFYLQELSEAIVRYLSPWAWDDAATGFASADIEFGGTWHKSSIIDFVEEQPYVDYLKNFEMYHKREISQPDAQWARMDQESIRATTARSVLVSHAQHVISAIT